jgi:predicted peroxiredoxin
MKKVAYIITRGGTQQLVQGCLLGTIANGRHGAKVLAMHFCEDAVYYLIKGTATAEKIEKAIKKRGVKVIACECSAETRNVQGQFIEGVQIGHFATFYEAADKADHIIAL